jgi:hypothetical protein
MNSSPIRAAQWPKPPRLLRLEHRAQAEFSELVPPLGRSAVIPEPPAYPLQAMQRIFAAALESVPFPAVGPHLRPGLRGPVGDAGVGQPPSRSPGLAALSTFPPVRLSPSLLTERVAERAVTPPRSEFQRPVPQVGIRSREPRLPSYRNRSKLAARALAGPRCF